MSEKKYQLFFDCARLYNVCACCQFSHMFKYLYLCLLLEAACQKLFSESSISLTSQSVYKLNNWGKVNVFPLPEKELLDRKQHLDVMAQWEQEDKLWVFGDSHQVLTSNIDNIY